MHDKMSNESNKTDKNREKLKRKIKCVIKQVRTDRRI